MKLLRASFKLIIFLIVTLFLYTLIMLCLVGSMFGLNYEKLRGYLLRIWGKCCCVILGIDLKVKNKPPEPPFLLVSNHLSYIDVFVLFSQLRCLFVAKSDVKTWPLVGFIIRTCGILFIDRERKRDVKRVNELISKNINENQGIILFPEGTTSPGMEVLPLKTSLLQYPASQKMPVSYASLSYQTNEEQRPAYESVCWWQEIPFAIHFWNLLKLKGFTATIAFGDKQITNDDRKLLALNLRKAMAENLDPVISEEQFHAKYPHYEPLLTV